MKIVYISRKIEEGQLLRSLIQEKSWTLIDLPMIRFQPVPFQLADYSFDVLFFTSPRSFHFFYEAHPEIMDQKKIACIGRSTQGYIEKQGFQLDFVGKNETQPEKVALDFLHWLGKQKVLIPQSNLSHQSIQKKILSSQCINVVVYETLLCPQQLAGTPDVLVFSSPSNAKAFLMANSILKEQRIWSWGETTQAYLASKGISSTIFNDFEEIVV